MVISDRIRTLEMSTAISKARWEETKLGSSECSLCTPCLLEIPPTCDKMDKMKYPDRRGGGRLHAWLSIYYSNNRVESGTQVKLCTCRESRHWSALYFLCTVLLICVLGYLITGTQYWACDKVIDNHPIVLEYLIIGTLSWIWKTKHTEVGWWLRCWL